MKFFLLPITLLVLFILERAFFRRYWRKGLDVTVTFSETTVRSGESVVVKEKSDNKKKIPLSFVSVEWGLERLCTQYKEDDKVFVLSSSFSLPPYSSVKRKKAISGLKRGIYTINNGKVTSSDLFSSEEYSYPLFSNSTLCVLPGRKKAFSSSYAYRGFLGTVLSSKMNQEDPFEIKAIRPYFPTDSMRVVNWKASAKTGSLKVNQYEWTTDESVMVLMDLSRGDEDEREALIEYVSSFCSLILARGVSLSLVSNGRDSVDGTLVKVGEGSGSGHIDTVDRALSTIKVTSSDNVSLSCFLENTLKEDLRCVPVFFSVSLEEVEIDNFFSLSSKEGAVFLMHGKKRENVFLLEEGDE
ncbi:MAG: DUF58 domain-containing protein [Candidatus Ornithospirochaeta sp.]